MLGRATWRAIGPAARTVIRPFMIFGPLPLAFATFVVIVGLMSAAAASPTGLTFTTCSRSAT